MKRGWLIFLLLAAAILYLLFRSSDKTTVGRPVTFSDGTTLTLLDVTYGTEHRLHGGTWRERLIKLLPKKWGLKFSSPKGVMTMSRPGIVLWIQHVGNGPPLPDPHLVLSDGTGFGIWAMDGMMRLSSSSNRVEGWAFNIWPRRDPYFTVGVYESIREWGNDKLIGEFSVRNPTHRKYPTWEPETLPITKSQGDLSLTLLKLVAGVGHGSNSKTRARNPVKSETRADFVIKEGGKTTKDWEVISTASSDATGNIVERRWGSGHEDDIEISELQPHPWPAESAWDLRVGISRKANFGAAELWTLQLPLSEAHITNTILWQTNLQGTVLSYTGQAPRSGYGIEGNRSFHFQLPRGETNFSITFVGATDEAGRAARLENYWSSPHERSFGLTVNTNSSSLDFTVAVHRTRYFDFRVRPTIFQ